MILFNFIYFFIHLFKVGNIQYQCTVKNSFPYKNKMLIKVNGAIKSIMNKHVKTNKLNFRTKIVNKTIF